MRKIWLIIPLLVVLTLTACQPATQVVTPTIAVPTVVTPSSDSITPAAAPAAATCGPFRLIDQVLPPADDRVTPVDQNDWARGPANPAVTFIEYSDFQ
jgi:hypothetical protein